MSIRGGSALTAVAVAYAISSMGDQVALVALTLRFYEQGASAVLISALVVAGVLPIVVVGMVAASVLLAPRVPVAAQPRVLVGAGLLMGVALTVVAVLPVLAVALVGFVCTGVANALQNLAVRNLIHAEVPAEVRGRAFACASALLNGANLSGTALGGPAVVVLGGATSILVAGLGAIAATLAAAPVLLRRRHATSDGPAAGPVIPR
ncbi:hypothetical protein [Verrucosispora sp. TAA-831]|uniref:hypothetical protein n=1 Tax=Verrucosispora sp. TAA-831 TaxID=3422227 RepID=UPI003D6E3E8D